MRIQPRNEYVVLKVIEAKKHGGIIVPGQETERNLLTVVSVGQGGLTVDGRRMPIEVSDGVPLKSGDVVFLKQGEYETFEHQKVQHLIVPQSALIGIELPQVND